MKPVDKDEQVARKIHDALCSQMHIGSTCECRPPMDSTALMENIAAALRAAREDEREANKVGLSLFYQLVGGDDNALRTLDVFPCNVLDHQDDCECFWERCEAWANQRKG